MNHVSQQQLEAYISDTLTDEERVIVEDHIYECELCLQQFMSGVEHDEHHLPASTTVPDFAHDILPVTAVEPSEEAESHQVKPSKSQAFRPLIHYVVAASITIILMASGLFQSILGWTSTINESSQHAEQSISDSIMDHTLQWIDLQYEQLKEGERK